MARDDKKIKKDTNDGSEEKNKGRKKKLIIIIAGVVMLVFLAAVAAFFFFKPKPETVEEKDPGFNVPVPVISQNQTIGPMVNIDEFIVNIISEEGNHYVKASLTIELNKVAVVEETHNRMPQIRDAILLLVGNKTFEELRDLQGKKQLKAELVSKINSFLQAGKVKAIYFTDFVVQ